MICGAGFAGLSASQKLFRHDKVTVIDPREDFEFQPNIHELVSGNKSPSDLKLDIRRVLSRRHHKLVRDRVKTIDVKSRQVLTEGGQRLNYDVCLLAIGGVPNDNGVDGVGEFTEQFKSIDDCAGIASKLDDLASKSQPYSVAIVGGGIEGVEVLGELLRKKGSDKNLSIKLIESGSRFLPSRSPKISQRIVEQCESLPVDLLFNLLVDRCDDGRLHLSDGSVLETDMIIWTGGVKSHPLLRSFSETSEAKSTEVTATLQSHLCRRLFVIGDCVDLSSDKEKQAYHAMDMGALAAENALRVLQHRPLLEYKPKTFPSVISFGDLNCFLEYEKFVLSGLPLALLKESIYQLNMEKLSKRDSRLVSRSDDPTELMRRVLKGLFRSKMNFLSSPLAWCERSSLRLL